MKLFGDEKSKKRIVKFGFAAITVSIVSVMVALALQVKPFQANLGNNPGEGDNSAEGGENPNGVAGGLIEDPEIKDITMDDLARFDTDRKQDYYNILLCGTDEDGTRTDTIMLISFDITEKKVSLLSVPRDTLVNVTRAVKKINSGYAVGGIAELKKELKSVTGVDVDRYAIVNFDAVEELIDAFGGVYFDVPWNMNFEDPTQDLKIHIDKGYQKLDGKNFVHCARYRTGYGNGDIDRINVQHDLLAAFAKQLIAPSTIPKIPRLASIIVKNVEADFTIGELISLAAAGLSVDPETIEMYTLPGGGETLKGQSYWVPYGSQIIKLINSNFNPSSKPITGLNLLDPATLRATKPDEKSGDGENASGGETESAPGEDLLPPDIFDEGSSEEDPIELDGD